MYLKRLEIQGFKSFANHTVLDFEPGITAVVGPNGSGKSNTADAVRWVLGEQSKAILRSKKGEDVIFVGSEKKVKAATASVSVVFDNHDHKLPIDSAEVVFSRKIHRDGESEYLINNQPARLMDISEALAKAGFAQSRYTVIGQGVIDQFLLQGPTEIKALIEEAAGISTLHHKREKTLRRLETTRENLVQVSALIGEIEPRLKTLRRQAKRLQERSVIEEQWRKLLSGRLRFTFGRLHQEKESLLAQIKQFEQQAQTLQEQIDKHYAKLEESESGSSGLSQKVSSLQVQISELQNRKEKIQVSLIETRLKIQNTAPRNTVDPVVQQSRLATLQKQLADLGRQITEAEGNLNQTETDIKEITDILSGVKADLVPRFKDIARKFITSQEQFLNRLHAQKTELEASFARTQADSGKMDLSAANPLLDLQKQNEQQLAQLEDQIAQAQNRIRAELESMSGAAEKRQAEDRRVRGLENELNKIRSQISDLKINLARVETRLEEEERNAASDLGSNFRQVLDLAQPIEDVSVDAQVMNLKKQLDMIGGLDEMTLQEYEETESRYSYLTSQVADLEKAAKDLEEVLQELDEIIKKKFNEAYNIISEKFSEYFRMLFNGGKASFNLIREKKEVVAEEEGEEIPEETEEQDPTAGITGIEVKATPPGKKLSSIAALSGGERTLTSIALLIALLDAYPSPFVVLDEVDAALDESNSIRFAKILHVLSDRTQFITVTHNRETMRQAHTLYGVTMGDDSVSKVLSIKLEQSLVFAKD